MGSKLEDAAESIGVDVRVLTSAPLRRRRRKEWLARFVTRRAALAATALGALTGAMALAASTRASEYPYSESSLPDTRPGPTTVFPTLGMALTILMVVGFDIVFNLTRYGDFFGIYTYYGVANADSGGEMDVTPT